MQRRKDPGQKELRQHNKRKYLVGGPLAVEAGHNQYPKRAPKKAVDQAHRKERRYLPQRNRQADDDPNGDYAKALRHRHQRLAHNLAHNDGVARNGRHKNLLAKIVFPVLDE